MEDSVFGIDDDSDVFEPVSVSSTDTGSLYSFYIYVTEMTTCEPIANSLFAEEQVEGSPWTQETDSNKGGEGYYT